MEAISYRRVPTQLDKLDIYYGIYLPLVIVLGPMGLLLLGQ